ncbi:uncharacterized [Tachysurus ichikawai]
MCLWQQENSKRKREDIDSSMKEGNMAHLIEIMQTVINVPPGLCGDGVGVAPVHTNILPLRARGLFFRDETFENSSCCPLQRLVFIHQSPRESVFDAHLQVQRVQK